MYVEYSIMNMSMKNKLLDIVYPTNYAFAHCDIPCGIYDPHTAQLDALTVVRMNQLIADLGDDSESQTKLGRYMSVKETHAESCKNELRIIWADYFKPEHLEKYPELHDLFWKAMKNASKTRQQVSLEAAEELLESVRKIAEIFWASKGSETKRQAFPSPAGGEIVYPVSD
jgi:nickel superoxide dismutase